MGGWFINNYSKLYSRKLTFSNTFISQHQHCKTNTNTHNVYNHTTTVCVCWNRATEQSGGQRAARHESAAGSGERGGGTREQHKAGQRQTAAPTAVLDAAAVHIGAPGRRLRPASTGPAPAGACGRVRRNDETKKTNLRFQSQLAEMDLEISDDELCRASYSAVPARR